MTKSPIFSSLKEIYLKYSTLNQGKPADYIPQLAKVDPNLFGICFCSTDGTIYQIGDAEYPFTIQSISKAFVYGLALADHGKEKVMQKVGVEPTGEAFNSIIFDEVNNRPYNPMVNAGAIATTALIQGDSPQQRFQRILNLFEDFVGHSLSIDEAVYQSESATGHRNRAIAYLELNSGMIDEPIQDHVEIYFRQCSILVTAKDLAIMSATLANNGLNPLTGKQVFEPEIIKSILSVMTSCGMYNFSGEWLYNVGLPAKSGVGGGIIAVLPAQFGIGTFSPPLDELGNSVRGLKVCEDISNRFNFHIFDIHTIAESVIRRTYTGAIVSSKKQRLQREKEILEENGSKIVIYELQGDLYFSSMENLLRHLFENYEDYAEDIKYIILDCHRVNNVNNSAISLLNSTKGTLSDEKISFILSAIPVHIQQKLKTQGWLDLNFTKDLDNALEWCENNLLSQYSIPKQESKEKLSLSDMDIFQNFPQEELDIIKPLLQEKYYQNQDIIIRQGDNSDRLFLLAQGNATVYIKMLHTKQKKRLTTYISGMCFGELGLFDSGKRTADVIADNDVTCYILKYDKLNDLIHKRPEIYLNLLKILGKSLAKTIKRNSAEISSFATN